TLLPYWPVFRGVCVPVPHREDRFLGSARLLVLSSRATRGICFSLVSWSPITVNSFRPSAPSSFCEGGSWASVRPRRGTIHRARPSTSYVGPVLPRRAAFLLVYVVAGLPRCVRPGSPPGRPVLGFRPPPSFVIPSNERDLIFSCLLVANRWSPITPSLNAHMQIELLFIGRRLLPGADVVQQQHPLSGTLGLKLEDLDAGPAHAGLLGLGLRLAHQLQQRRGVLMEVPHEPGRGIRFQAHLETLPNFQANLPALVRIGKHLVLRGSNEQLPRGAQHHQQKKPSCSVPHPVPPPRRFMACRALLHRVIPTGENRSFLSRGFCAPVRGVEGSACLLLLSCQSSLVCPPQLRRRRATAFSPRSREHTSVWRVRQLAAWRCTRGCPILAVLVYARHAFCVPDGVAGVALGVPSVL